MSAASHTFRSSSRKLPAVPPRPEGLPGRAPASTGPGRPRRARAASSGAAIRAAHTLARSAGGGRFPPVKPPMRALHEASVQAGAGVASRRPRWDRAVPRLVSMTDASPPIPLERVLGDLPLVAYVYDLVENTNVYVNRRWQDEFGYSERDLRSHPHFVLSLMHPEDAPRARRHYEALRNSQGDGTRIFEYRLRRKSGSWVWLESHDRVFDRDAQGRATHIIGTALDISERKARDAASQESDARFQAVVEQHPDAVFIADLEGRLLEVNASATRQLGYTRQELLQLRIADIVAPEYSARAQDRIRRGTLPGYLESANIRKDGSRVPVETAVLPIRIGGQLVTLAVSRDISERIAAQASFRREAELRQAMIEQATDGLGLCELIAGEPGVRFEIWNQHMVEITGYRLDEVNRLGWLALIAQDDAAREHAIHRLERILAGEDLDAEQWTLRTQSGTVRTVQVSTRLIRGPGEERKIFILARDLTERLRMEAQLQEGQRLEAVGRLAGAVAHDFNNLLAGVLGASSLLGDAPGLGEQERQLLADISAAAERGGALTQQLLTFSKRQRTEMVVLDWSAHIDGVLRVVRRLLGNRVAIETAIEPGCRVLGDAGMLDQIVMNLAVNGRDAMPRGGTLRITLGLEEASATATEGAAPGSVVLRVSDGGEGIPREALPHIFEPFFTTKEANSGTGLGLATVYGIVTQHGGRIAVESTTAEDEASAGGGDGSSRSSGSTFSVWLPQVKSKPQQRSATPQGQLRSGLCVLLVEDNAMVRRVTRRMLQGRGHRVLEAPSGEVALRLFAEHREEVSILLSDIALGGGIDGVRLASQLLEQRPGLPVLLMSGYDDTQRGSPPGCHFLQKPFRRNDLEFALNACFSD